MNVIKETCYLQSHDKMRGCYYEKCGQKTDELSLKMNLQIGKDLTKERMSSHLGFLLL